MGRVRTKTVKKASKIIIEKYYPRLTLDFDTNKKICAEVAVIPSKRLRNKIAGYTTHLMRRIQKGPVRGISFKLQEEERERKDNYVPDVSAIETDLIEIDADTKEMLKSIGFDDIPGVSVVALENLQPQQRERTFEDRRERGERTERGERGAGERGERSGEKRTGGAGGEGRQRTGEGQQRTGGEKRTGGAGGEGRSERGGARGGRGGRGGARGGARTGGAGGERRGPRGDGGKPRQQGGDESRA